jgi:hypothetical protein
MRSNQRSSWVTVQFMFAFGFSFLAMGCEGPEGDENCILESAYLCVAEGCYCADDSQWDNPLTQTEAEKECARCRPPVSDNDDENTTGGFNQYDRFGGIDDFSGDNDWGSGPR